MKRELEPQRTGEKSRRWQFGLCILLCSLPLCFQTGGSQLAAQAPPPGPTIIGPGLAPNIGTPVSPGAGSYYGPYGDPDYNASLRGMYSNNRYGYVFESQDIPQTTTRTRIQMVGKSQISVTWEGPTHSVGSVRVVLLDKSGKTLAQKLITKVPTKATLTRSSKAAQCIVTVNYINGMTSTVSSDMQ